MPCTTPSSSAKSGVARPVSAARSSAKAAVFFGPGKPFEIREVSIPEVEANGVLIRVTSDNICGSDLHFWRGALEMLRSGGTYLEIGTISRGAKIELEPSLLVRGSKRIVGVNIARATLTP